jgi:predicted O-methyltransferase YrrM
MKGAAVAGCLDLNHKELADRLRIDKYVNAGVLLIDLDQWRQYDYTTRCIEHTQTIHENIIFADQCAINIFFSDRIEILDPKWNFYVTPSINLDDLRGKSILHYISAQKPWQVNYNPKNSRYYWRYLEVSPWRDIESSRLQPDNKADGLEQTTVHPRSILPKLLAIYRSVGLEPLTGYNPLHFSSWEAAPFTKFVCNGQLVGVSGLALQEVMFLEGLSGLTHPASVLVIGNALGWSAVALSLIFPQARILTLDPDTQGNSITNKIAQIHHLKISAVTGISPDDIPSILHNKSNTSLDLCLIDAIHENENLRNDFAAIYHHLSPGAMVLMHDVIDWNMMIAFEEILRKPGISGRLLTRTASGMGLVWKSDISPTLLDYISSFTESAELYKGYQTIVRQSLLKKSEAAVNHYR